MASSLTSKCLLFSFCRGQLSSVTQNDIQNNIDDDDFVVTWRKLFMFRGLDLWNVRKRAFSMQQQQHQSPPPSQSNDDDDDALRSTCNHACVKMPVTVANTRKQRKQLRQCVCIISSIERFKQLETDHGMGKFDQTSKRDLPLTDCTGEQWIRQRRQVADAFGDDLPERSLQAAVEAVCIVDDQKMTTSSSSGKREGDDRIMMLDMKQFVLKIALRWVVRLFHGRPRKSHTDGGNVYEKYDKQLETACFEFYLKIRAWKKQWKSFHEAETHFMNVLRRYDGMEQQENDDDHHNGVSSTSGEGVLQGLYHRSGLSKGEATANAVNGMIAALDAVQSLVFWTVWNLSRTDRAWMECRKELMAADGQHSQSQLQEQEENDLSILKALKKKATLGEPIHLHELVAGASNDGSKRKGLSYLGRALFETLRVYPPIWTIPRTWPDSIPSSSCSCPYGKGNNGHGKGGKENGHSNNSNNNNLDTSYADGVIISGKLDVPTANGVLDRNWDPSAWSDTTKGVVVASFGVGKRHCPAGTAALYAAYVILKKIICTYKFVEECSTNKNGALDDVYLGPTLCVEGPQVFRLLYSEHITSQKRNSKPS